jgi:predicted oxidoreductase
MITGVPAYVDGRMLDIAAESGVRLVNRDRGYNALEGTFLGGCLFSGRTAGRDLTDRL